MSFLTTTNNYSASDIGTLRKTISIEKWLTVDDKRALLIQLDSMLDSMTGFQIPDDLGMDRKYWGMYSLCADANSLPAGEYTGLDETSVLGFPLRDFIPHIYMVWRLRHRENHILPLQRQSRFT